MLQKHHDFLKDVVIGGLERKKKKKAISLNTETSFYASNMTRSGLGSEFGRVTNPTENLQRTPKFSCYIHKDVDCTMGSFIESKPFFNLRLKKKIMKEISPC